MAYEVETAISVVLLKLPGVKWKWWDRIELVVRGKRVKLASRGKKSSHLTFHSSVLIITDTLSTAYRQRKLSPNPDTGKKHLQRFLEKADPKLLLSLKNPFN